ncbi:MAG: ATP-binding cassette domain-containing protein [Lachnospiraceae bacterium]|nr:ATP-binding cassette domain-containing protein [Lachnospiraceae bacterium]
MAEIYAERNIAHPDDARDCYIQLHHVRKRFGTEEVLKPLDFAVERGKTYGICGNNGSGKTVLMKCICGFLPVTEGLVTVDGKRIGLDVDFPESLGVIIETPGFLSNLSGRKNLEILADLRGKIGRKEITSVLMRVGLDPELKKPVAKYSLGMRQRLGIAQAIMEEPEFLILDEPFNGLDRHGVAEIRKLLLFEKQKRKTILLASHNSEDIRILCDRVFEMDGGVMREITNRIE